MKFRDIFAVASSGATHDSAVAVAQQLAIQNDGKVSALQVAWMPALIMAEGWVASPVWGDIRAQAAARLTLDLDALNARLKAGLPATGTVEGELLELGLFADAVAVRARHHDVTVVGCAQTDAQRRLAEAALFASGRPVILAPVAWKPRDIGRNIVVCWKPSREAARALAEADDLLAHAYRVAVVRVDVDHAEDDCLAAGGDIAAHLGRRGVAVQSCVLAPLGRSEARAVLDHAAAVDADLIVMGGYGRSRMSEFVFGGMTREMLRSTNIPILMAH